VRVAPRPHQSISKFGRGPHLSIQALCCAFAAYYAVHYAANAVHACMHAHPPTHPHTHLGLALAQPGLVGLVDDPHARTRRARGGSRPGRRLPGAEHLGARSWHGCSRAASSCTAAACRAAVVRVDGQASSAAWAPCSSLLLDATALLRHASSCTHVVSGSPVVAAVAQSAFGHRAGLPTALPCALLLIGLQQTKQLARRS
jgi:hypothetical protein